ncbi:nucleotidyltransferase domain-containing protein [Elusimicrobiota bacterium]
MFANPLPLDSAARKLLIDHITAEIPEVVAIYAYGSRVKGGARPDSDLDIALLLQRGKQVSFFKLLQIQGDLEAVIGYRVEVSVLDSSLVHCKEVVSGGIVLYAADERALAEFEMRTFSDYARLCEDRTPVVEAYTHG